MGVRDVTIRARGGGGMTAKQWLEQVREADAEILRLRHAMFDAWLLCTRTVGSVSQAPVQTTPEPHRMDSIAILDEAIYDRIREINAQKAQAVRVICALPDPRQRQVLLSYYVDSRDKNGQRKTWEAVAVELGYSWRQLIRIRDAAIASLPAEKMS